MASPDHDGPAPDGPSPEIVAFLESAAVPAFLTGPDGGPLLFVNPALLTTTGFMSADLVGHDLARLRSGGADRLAWTRFRDEAAAGPATADLLCARGDGGSFWGEISLGPVSGPDGPGYRFGLIVDVSRRVDAEGALALSRQREALGLLTNSVAHEFNNFLQILIGYIDGLKRRLADRPEPFVQRAVIRSTEAAERATTLTRQLLAHSRRIAPDVRPVDLDALVGQIGERLRPTLPTRVTLTLSPSGDLSPALANPTQVELALSHILANAAESITGTGTITVSTFAVAPGDRTLQSPQNGAAGIAIRDSGHGMSPEMLTRALAPFATSREAGRGVGLAIVHGLMKRQSGTVSLESRPGEGTTVRLIFPAAG